MDSREEMQAEIASLKDEVNKNARKLQNYIGMWKDSQAEVERLRAEQRESADNDVRAFASLQAQARREHERAEQAEARLGEEIALRQHAEKVQRENWAEVERLRADKARPDLEARIYALLVEFFGSNLRGDQQTLHHRLTSIVIEATLRAEQAEARLREVVEALDHAAIALHNQAFPSSSWEMEQDRIAAAETAETFARAALAAAQPEEHRPVWSREHDSLTPRQFCGKCDEPWPCSATQPEEKP